MEQLLEIFERSFQEGAFSSTDRKAVKEYIRERRLEKREKDYLRSRLFDMAKSRLQEQDYLSVLEWLENASKSLSGRQNHSMDNIVYFSPGEECLSALTSRMNLAASSIKICVFTISDDRITEAILKAHQLNVSVKIITDNDKVYDEGSDIHRMYEAGIPIKIDTTSNHMHHKFLVVDHRVALTGSYNWTRSAACANYENLLVTDEKHIVSAYEREFDKLWDEMVDYGQAG